MSVDPAESKKVAIELISNAWKEASDRDISADLVASAALTAALSSLVQSQGEEATKKIVGHLLEAVTSGKFGHSH